MFCVNCGTKIGGVNFCPECGTKKSFSSELEQSMIIEEESLTEVSDVKELIEEAQDVNEGNENVGDNNISQGNNLTASIEQSLEIYCDKYFGGKRILSIEKYLKIANPLKRLRGFTVWLFAALGCFVGPAGTIFGLIIGYLLYKVICFFNAYKITTFSTRNGEINDIKELYRFLDDNLKIDEIEIIDYTSDSINFIFKRSTKHQLFYDKKNSKYIVRWCGATTKHRLIHSGVSFELMFKHSVLLNPVVLGYVDYYVKSCNER